MNCSQAVFGPDLIVLISLTTYPIGTSYSAWLEDIGDLDDISNFCPPKNHAPVKEFVSVEKKNVLIYFKKKWRRR